jgi:hypothetical protein
MLAQEIHPKASNLRDFIGEVEITARLENLSLAFCEYGEQRHFIPIKAVDLRKWLEASMQSHQGW